MYQQSNHTAASGGKLRDIKEWWDQLGEIGPLFGYHPKASKTWLIVKPEFIQKAKDMFPDINITDVGHKYLGSYIGTDAGKQTFVEDKVKEWMKDIEDLADIATREPQAAYSAYIYGLSKRWNYVCRTTPGISQYLKKLEHKVKECFIPAIIDRAFGCQEIYRKIFALPIKEGGLGIVNLSLISDLEYEYSREATMELTEAIFQQAPSYIEDHDKLVKVKDKISSARRDFFKGKRSEIMLELNQNQKLQLDLASEKGASSWLSSLPLKSFGFVLNKQEFTDAIALRYNFTIKDSARKCVCGEANTINHALSCKRGGYVSLRHNSLRDMIAELLRTAGCKDVTTEPPLLPVSGAHLPRGSNTSDGARLDVSARSLWNPLERAFVDVRVFNAQAPSNRSLGATASMYSFHERQKKNAYNRRIIEIDHGTFTPIVFSTTGGMGHEAEVFFKKLADKMSRKTDQRYSEAMSFIRKRLRFDLLRTTIISLRGERGRSNNEASKISELDINLEPQI